MSLFLLLAPAGAHAAGPGTTAASFLKIPVGAREASLGGAFTAAAEGPAGVFYNPAGLYGQESAELSYSYNEYLPGISQHWLAASGPSRLGAWGLGLNYLYIEPFASYDASDNRTGSVSAGDLAVYLGYGAGFDTGLGLAPRARLGGTLKYVSQRLDSRSAAGYGADAGLLLITGTRLRLGLAGENLVSSRLEFDGGGARLPRKLKAGASYAAGPDGGTVSSMLSLDFNFPEDGPRYLSAGLETVLYGALALRAGYSSFGDISNGLSFGLGLAMPSAGRRLRLDYSYGSTYDLGSTHRFGVSCAFGRGAQAAAQRRPGKKAAPEAKEEAAAADPPDGLKGLLEPLYGDDPLKSMEAAGAMAKLSDPRAVDHFLALLSSGRAGWQAAALHGLSLSRDPRAAEALRNALRHPDPVMRKQAALAIGRRGGPDAPARLIEALRAEGSEEVKSAILEVLGAAKAAEGAGAQ